MDKVLFALFSSMFLLLSLEEAQVVFLDKRSSPSKEVFNSKDPVGALNVVRLICCLFEFHQAEIS